MEKIIRKSRLMIIIMRKLMKRGLLYSLALNPRVRIFSVSCQTGKGLEAWFSWLEAAVKDRKNQ